MMGYKPVSRLNLSFCVNQIAKKTGIHSWFGVQKVLLNDKRWGTLHKCQKILPRFILNHCDASGLASTTIKRLDILVDAAIKTNNNMRKIVKLLTKINSGQRFCTNILKKGYNMPISLVRRKMATQENSCINFQRHKNNLECISFESKTHHCNNNNSDLQFAIYNSLKYKMKQESNKLIEKIESDTKECSICTFHNHITMSYCEICGFTFTET